MACCHTMSNQYELPRAVGPPRHISGKVAALRRDGCSFEIHFNASPQHSHMAPFSETPGNGLLCRDQGRGKRPRGRSLTIATRVPPLYDFFFLPRPPLRKPPPKKTLVFNTRAALRLTENCSSSTGCKIFSRSSIWCSRRKLVEFAEEKHVKEVVNLGLKFHLLVT